MLRRERLLHPCLVATAVAAAAGLSLAGRIPQDPAYHEFADSRAILGIPNAIDVLSNLPFCVVGILGLLRVWRLRRTGIRGTFHRGAGERLPFAVFFLGVALVGIGSAWYHLDPQNGTLLWDRLALVIAPGALLAAALAERSDPRLARILLPALVLGGIASVLLWFAGEEAGHGDLRAYAFFQLWPGVGIAVTVLCRGGGVTRGRDYLVVLGWYALAKAFEGLDGAIYSLGGVVSGHTLKHLAAAAAAAWVVRMLRLR